MHAPDAVGRGLVSRHLVSVRDQRGGSRATPRPVRDGALLARWRVEDAFNAIKRLLGLAYFWVGSTNGILVQGWATWLLYAVLVDLTDAVAEELHRPFIALSMEMVFRGLYHFTQAHQRGQADDPVAYLAAKAKKPDLLKQRRKNSPNDLLNLTNLSGP